MAPMVGRRRRTGEGREAWSGTSRSAVVPGPGCDRPRTTTQPRTADRARPEDHARRHEPLDTVVPLGSVLSSPGRGAARAGRAALTRPDVRSLITDAHH